MEKVGFGDCLQWLKRVDESSIKDFETFCASFKIEPTATANTPPTKVSKKKKHMGVMEEDNSYVESGDIDSDYNSEEENEVELELNKENFLDEGMINFISISLHILT